MRESCGNETQLPTHLSTFGRLFRTSTWVQPSAMAERKGMASNTAASTSRWPLHSEQNTVRRQWGSCNSSCNGSCNDQPKARGDAQQMRRLLSRRLRIAHEAAQNPESDQACFAPFFSVVPNQAHRCSMGPPATSGTAAEALRHATRSSLERKLERSTESRVSSEDATTCKQASMLRDRRVMRARWRHPDRGSKACTVPLLLLLLLLLTGAPSGCTSPAHHATHPPPRPTNHPYLEGQGGGQHGVPVQRVHAVHDVVN